FRDADDTRGLAMSGPQARSAIVVAARRTPIGKVRGMLRRLQVEELAAPGLTVDRQCGSGLEAIVQAARLIEAGAGEVYLAGGVESCSTAPLRYAAED